MAINQLSTANTFQQWLVATQSLISVANNLTDGIGGTFYANTDVTIDGNLIVTGNITLEAVGYDDLYVSGNTEITGNLSVSGTANIETFIGTANTNIYNAIANVSTTVGGESIAFAIALG